MTDQEKTESLSQIFFFQSLPLSDIRIIASATTEKIIPAHEIFIEQGEDGNGAYFIIDGGVRVFRMTENGEIVNLAVLGNGEVIGEMSLIDDEPRSASIEAIKDTKVLVLTKEEFSSLLSNHSEIAIDMMCILTKRVRALNEYVEDVLSKNLHQRTWKMLKAISIYFPDQNITLSQEEIANVIGATRARVTEVLNSLQTEGKITLSHKKIHIN